MLDHAGKYTAEDKFTKIKYNPKKSNQHKTQQNKTTLL